MAMEVEQFKDFQELERKIDRKIPKILRKKPWCAFKCQLSQSISQSNAHRIGLWENLLVTALYLMVKTMVSG